MNYTWVVMWNDRGKHTPLWAFDTARKAEAYITQACTNALADGWPMESYSRENFYTLRVDYWQ